MITFLASPQPFVGIAKEHQYRAIRSWQTCGDDVEIILYGDSRGIDEAAAELGVHVVKGVASTSSGIPYFDAIASHASKHARYDLQIYINCDILLSGYLQAVSSIDFPQFLLIGQRIDLGEGIFIDVGQPDWFKALLQSAQEGNIRLFPPTGIDYFGFRRGFWKELAPVVIGRAGYDNALLAYCLRRRIPIVDATFAVAALHQYHDYGHVMGGQQAVWEGEDAIKNIQYAGGRRSLPILSDANYLLNGSSLKFWPCRGNWLRKLQIKLRYEADCSTAALVPRMILQVLRGLGITVGHQFTLHEVLEHLMSI